MATAAFTAIPDLDYDVTIERPARHFSFAGKGGSQRVSWQDADARHYAWPLHRGETERASIETFFRARSQTVESFYVSDVDYPTATGISLGTSTVAGTTSFSLPTTGDSRRLFMKNDAVAVIKDDGVITSTTYSIYTDARTVGFSTAPASGSVILAATFTAYRLVHLVEPVTWSRIAHNWSFTTLDMMEVSE